MQTLSTTKQGIVFFDGICNFCHGAVKFILPRDRHRYFRFATLQSDVAAQLLAKHPTAMTGTSLVLMEQGKIYLKSTAVLRIARRLGGLWPMCSLLLVIPRPVRDLVYDYVARNRYRWFGQLDACQIPDVAQRERFLD